ncbi:glycosyltransferase family 4 protein [Stenomitos frigidus]|uniref:Glycoside hydrolase n=1 Tax=Stenomitos frigidus ULC18 TaxID=2107698 RepID=A0A2T1EGI0_9CYAN|nr:glycosyltransferase family 1 protein [Stenomitos frigidus]PSB31839.1 glycoside hydrolase [Stenomitos frigidus ULC18]
MVFLNRKRLALISVHGDPAIEVGKEEAGGQNVYVRNVGEALSHQGWHVDMFTRRVSADQAAIVEHNAHCRTIRLTAGPQEFIPRDEIFEFLPEFVQGFLDFQKQLDAPYRLIHSNYWLSSWVGMDLSKKLSIPQAHTYHSLGAVKYKSVSTIPLIAKTRLAVEKTCLETVNRVVATSPQERDHMRSLVSSRGSIDIIPCGTRIDHFGTVTQADARQALGIAPDEKVVLYVGRFDPRKGIETLLRAVDACQARKTENVRLIIGGGSRPGHSDGDERERIESIVSELGLEGVTQFAGRLSQDDLPSYYAAADVCVVPSHYEPFGLVTIEAMACGTPVVGSDVGGLQFTVVPERTGLLAPPKDVAAFAASIDRLLLNPTWRHTLGQAARKRVETTFSWDGVATQLGKLYEVLLEEASQEASQEQSSKKLAQASA